MPSNFLKWGKWGADYVVLVDKSQQKVMLYRSDNLLTPEKVYHCSTGENDGRKSALNDKKTPEGIYFFVKSYTKESLAPIYGARALPLNYPNIFDLREGRDGYGIWFHGLNKPLKPYDTSGCVALENKDIEDLATYVSLFNTPVIISSSIEMSPQGEIETKAKDIADIIEGWRDSWQNRDVERYMSFYSLSFKSGSKDWSQWKDYKKQVTNKYKDIRVKVDALGILMNNNMVIASFKQTYRTPVFESSGTKRLYIAKNSDEWKIIGEDFSLEEIKPVTGIGPEPENAQIASVDEERIASATSLPGVREDADTSKVAAINPVPGNPPVMAADTEQVASTTPLAGARQEDDADSKQVAATMPVPETPQLEAGEAKQVVLTAPSQPGIQREETAEATEVSLTVAQTDNFQAEIETVIISWIDAWEKKDTERYITFYDAGFRSRGMDLKAWERHRNRVNIRNQIINVEISGLKITRVSDDQADVAFIQDYSADNYADHGEKNMVLIKKGKEWKIKKEEWIEISK